VSFRRSFLGASFAIVVGLANTGCPSRPPVAPTYQVKSGAPVAEQEVPLALTHYVFSKPNTVGRTGLAKGLAERMLVRSKQLFDAGREKSALAAVRLAATILRANHVDPTVLTDVAVAELDVAVQGPAARGEEGTAMGIYELWLAARPTDARPKDHLAALATWNASTQGVPSALVALGRDGLRKSEALAYLPSDVDRGAADEALMKWMDQIVAFKDGERTPARYADEVYWAVMGFHTAGARLVAGHLRDGDLGGAVEAISAPSVQGFVSDPLRRALLDAGATPGPEGYVGLFKACLGEARREGLDEAMNDAIVGTALTGAPDYPGDAIIAEAVAAGALVAGAGDASPAILAHALLGTKDDPRRPAAKDVGRALLVTASAMREYADREDYDGARRTYGAASPLLRAADDVGGVDPSSAMIMTLMAQIEGEAGKLDVARKLFDDAISVEPLPTALAGRARLDARDGNLSDARDRVEKALKSKNLEHEPVLRADLLALAGDLARRAGDVNAARTSYEQALRLLSALKSSKNVSESDLARRAARILSRFTDAETKEDEAASIAESAQNEPQMVSISLMHRFVRALRVPDAKRARAEFRRATQLGLPIEDVVRAAILARAIAKRASATPDPEVQHVLTTAAAKDDLGGRIARFALGTLDADTLLSKATTPRHRQHALLAIALVKWGDGGLAAAKKDLDAVVKEGVLGAVDVDLALEVLEPEKGALTDGAKLAF
jgi:tetratricopeptide (TPR) repeat protein